MGKRKKEKGQVSEKTGNDVNKWSGRTIEWKRLEIQVQIMGTFLDQPVSRVKKKSNLIQFKCNLIKFNSIQFNSVHFIPRVAVIHLRLFKLCTTVSISHNQNLIFMSTLEGVSTDLPYCTVCHSDSKIWHDKINKRISSF